MSMSEFERYPNGSEDVLHHLSLDAVDIPDDFSADDIAFAQELDTFFDLDQEEVPPLFVQTLLATNDARFQAVETGFETKTRARVLRRLKLPRRLFRSSPSPWQNITSILSMRRSFFAIMITTFLLMLLSMVYTAPAFASGMSVLLAGPHSGVLQVRAYPDSLANAHPARSSNQPPAAHSKQRISMLEALHMLHFSMYWPQPDVMPNNYTLDNVYIYNGIKRVWADGPIVELDYDYTFPGATPRGTGHIAICEFKPMGQVLQVVQLGSAHELKIDANGNATALYVNGQWTSINNSSHVWEYGGRSELIYERNGIIFWIVGNQNDGVSGATLSVIASSLNVFDPAYTIHMRRVFDNVTQSQDAVPQLLAGDVIYTDNPDNSDGPTLKVFGGYEATNAHQPAITFRHPERLAPPTS